MPRGAQAEHRGPRATGARRSRAVVIRVGRRRRALRGIAHIPERSIIGGPDPLPNARPERRADLEWAAENSVMPGPEEVRRRGVRIEEGGPPGGREIGHEFGAGGSGTRAGSALTHLRDANEGRFRCQTRGFGPSRGVVRPLWNDSGFHRLVAAPKIPEGYDCRLEANRRGHTATLLPNLGSTRKVTDATLVPSEHGGPLF